MVRPAAALSPTQAHGATMKPSSAKAFVKRTVIAAGLIALTLAALIAVTDPEPATLPSREPVAHGPIAGFVRSEGSARARAEARVRPDWDDSFDDSGYASAIRFSKPIADASSLAQLRDSVAGRGRRGIAYLQEKLESLSPSDPAARSTAADMHLVLGSLFLCEGQWAEASDQFARARTADPARAPLYRAKLTALMGVSALRRGEIENCVACCNESSCIFPLAPAAFHRRTSGSREAIEHFTRYLEQQPGDLGIQWLLNVAFMTLGEYPDRVPPEWRLPLGRLDATGNRGQTMVNIATRVGLNVRGESMAGGCLVDDFDNDGRLDVFMPTTDAERGALFLRNRGDGTFEDVWGRPDYTTRSSR